MRFSFRTAGQVLFGRGEALRAAEIAASLGRHALLVTGAASLEESGRLRPILERLGGRERCTRFVVSGEPDVGVVDAAVTLARAHGCDVVVGCGGGSALDVAKAAASLLANGGQALDYLEDVGPGGGRAITHPSLPTVLIPTTAGTGAEVTRNAVLRVPDRSVKRSMRSDLLLPRVAAVDPDLMQGAPRAVAAAAGLDALTHLAEALVSRAAQPVTDALARQGIPLALQGLVALEGERSCPEAAEGLALAALYGGMAVANAGLGAAHGLVAPLGGLLGISHGVGCAALLPSVMLANLEALRATGGGPGAADAGAPLPSGGGPSVLERYDELARLVLMGMGDEGTPTVERAAWRLHGLRARLGLPGLRDMAVAETSLPRLLRECRGGSMKANPVELSDEVLGRILRGEYESAIARGADA